MGPNHLISLWSFGPNMICFILGFHEISTKRQRGINQRSPWIFQVLFNCCFSKLLWVTVMKNPFCDLCQISIIYLRIYYTPPSILVWIFREKFLSRQLLSMYIPTVSHLCCQYKGKFLKILRNYITWSHPLRYTFFVKSQHS